MTPESSSIPASGGASGHDVAARLPRELALELLALARAHGAEFADLYAEYTLQTVFALDEQRLKRSSVGVLQGVGVRAIRGAQTGYAYADGFAPADLREAARVAARIARDGAASPIPPFRVSDPPAPFTLRAPAPATLDEPSKIAMLRRADDAARASDPRVREVEVAHADSTKSFVVANSDGLWSEDRQFLSRLSVTVLACS